MDRTPTMSRNAELTAIETACRLLADCNSLGEIKAVRDKAEAVRVYAHNAKLGLEVFNRAAELKLRAERKVGQLLSELNLRGGDRKSQNWNSRMTLEDLGITQNQSKRWQQRASVPERVFQEFIDRSNAEGVEISSARLLRLARSIRRGGKADQRSNRDRRKDECVCRGCVRSSGRLQPHPVEDACQMVSELMGNHEALSNILESFDDSKATAKSLRMLKYYVSEMGVHIVKLNATLRRLQVGGAVEDQ